MCVLCRLHGLQASILLCDTGIRHIWTRQLIPERGPTRIRGSIRMRPYRARVIVFTCWFSRITMIIPAVVRLITQRFIFNTSHEDAVLRSFCYPARSLCIHALAGIHWRILLRLLWLPFCCRVFTPLPSTLARSLVTNVLQ